MLENIKTKEDKILDIMIDYIELREKYLSTIDYLYKSEDENAKLKKTVEKLKEQLETCNYTKNI